MRHWLGIITMLQVAQVLDAGICKKKDYSQPAKCYLNEFPEVYQKSKPIFRVWIRFEEYLLSHCTAWLLGCDGHVLTNKHCVDSQVMANLLAFEMMAEGDACQDECKEGMWPCPGSVFIDVDEPLEVVKLGSTDDFDYALLRLPEAHRSLWRDYGYLQLRNASVLANETIYVPQHPLGYGKRVAMYSNPPNSTNFSNLTTREFTKIIQADAPGFNSCGQYQITHNADTASGASGAPIISFQDHKVIALHHCSGCDTYGYNGAIPSQKLIQDIGSELPKCAISGT